MAEITPEDIDLAQVYDLVAGSFWQIEDMGICPKGMCLTGIAYGFSPTIMSGFVNLIYGPDYFATNFSIASFTLIPCSFAATVAGIMYTHTGTYFVPLAAAAVISAVSFGMAVIIRKVVKTDL